MRIPPINSKILIVKELDKETIYFNLRSDICITKFNYMDRFVSGTKPMKGKESKIPIHPVRKNQRNDS